MLNRKVPPLRPLRPFPLIAGLLANWYQPWSLRVCRSFRGVRGPNPHRVTRVIDTRDAVNVQTGHLTR
jgi:hypothetical protein